MLDRAMSNVVVGEQIMPRYGGAGKSLRARTRREHVHLAERDEREWLSYPTNPSPAGSSPGAASPPPRSPARSCTPARSAAPGHAGPPPNGRGSSTGAPRRRFRTVVTRCGSPTEVPRTAEPARSRRRARRAATGGLTTPRPARARPGRGARARRCSRRWSASACRAGRRPRCRSRAGGECPRRG